MLECYFLAFQRILIRIPHSIRLLQARTSESLSHINVIEVSEQI
jgi:hypothetical protein